MKSILGQDPKQGVGTSNHGLSFLCLQSSQGPCALLGTDNRVGWVFGGFSVPSLEGVAESGYGKWEPWSPCYLPSYKDVRSSSLQFMIK